MAGCRCINELPIDIYQMVNNTLSAPAIVLSQVDHVRSTEMKPLRSAAAPAPPQQTHTTNTKFSCFMINARNANALSSGGAEKKESQKQKANKHSTRRKNRYYFFRFLCAVVRYFLARLDGTWELQWKEMKFILINVFMMKIV